MPLTFTQENRDLEVMTPLGKDVLLLVGFSGSESISSLFSYHLELLSEVREQVAFDKLLGQPILVRIALPDGSQRYFGGICNRVSQGEQEGDAETMSTFTSYNLEMVPHFWLLTRRIQSRIFQHLTVPEILKQVFKGLNVSYELRGSFQPRDYCVQYRETDFDFASRLLEEEGIFYFFKHDNSGHQMVVANTPQAHPDLPYSSEIIFETFTEGVREDDRISNWEKTQELRSGKVTLWDHCFELPHKNLEGTQTIQENAAAGTVLHKFRVGENEKLEIYDYPGEYAQRFDGIDKGGGERPADIQKIFEDNRRTANIRMQQEAVSGLTIRGSSNCRHLVSGYKFQLKNHYDANGAYVLTSVEHSARSNPYRSGSNATFQYANSFSCIPVQVPFSPLRQTPKPRVQGTQTAVVVGPQGEEIFTDKYGRVKVQFHWDREGQADSDSSCWIRVAQTSAGLRWGSFFLPRIGHEVVVAFQEGDPDQPIIIGSVYNAQEMPPYGLPDEKTKTVLFKSNTSPGGSGCNEIRMEDAKGAEQIFIHGERNEDIRIKNDQFQLIGNKRNLVVEGDHLEKVDGDKHLIVKGDSNANVKGSLSEEIEDDTFLKIGGRLATQVGQEMHFKAGTNIVLEAGTTFTVNVGGNFITIDSTGVFINGSQVFINSGGVAVPGSGSQPDEAKQAENPVDAKSGEASKRRSVAPPVKPANLSPAAVAMQHAAQSGAPYCAICEAAKKILNN